MAYLGCIFDLDGTLADTLHSIAYFGNGALKAFDLPTVPVIEYKQMVGNGADLLVRRMLARAGANLPEEEIRRFRAEYDRRYAEDPLALVGAYPGLPEVLDRLHKKGMKLGVLSNKPDDMTQAIAGKLYGGVLDVARGQRAGVPMKPDPTALLGMARELGLAPGDVLYVGDSGVDMDTGRNAGMDTCGALWGFREKAELVEHGAAYLAADPAQLQKIIEKR